MNRKEKTSVAVEIFGTKYRLLADSSSASYVTMVGAHVDEQMHAIAKQHPRLDISRLAVLAAINIADDLLKTKEQLDREHAVSVERKNQELNSLQEKYAGAVQQLDEAKSELEAAKATRLIRRNRSWKQRRPKSIRRNRSWKQRRPKSIRRNRSWKRLRPRLIRRKQVWMRRKRIMRSCKPSWRRCGNSFASRRSGP